MEVIVKQLNSNFLRNSLNRNSVKYIGGWITRSGLPYSGAFTNEERREYEKLLGYSEGYLDPGNVKFWDSFIAVKLQGNRPVVLDTDKPEDRFKYEYCKHHIEVMDGYEDKKPRALYVMINEEAEAKKKNIANEKKVAAIKEYDKMSIDDIIACLRLFGVNSRDLSSEKCRERMFDIVINKPSDFMTKWTNNKDRDFYILIEDALSKNVLRRNRNVYYYGTDTIGTSLTDTVSYLKSKANQEIYLAIKAEVESK